MKTSLNETLEDQNNRTNENIVQDKDSYNFKRLSGIKNKYT